MKVKQKVLQTIEEHDLFKQNAHIVLGLSGGSDSLCLFDILCELADEMNLSIHPVHVNHMLRPGDAEEDQAFVENLCSQRGLDCRSVVCDCRALASSKGLTPEEAGRRARYEAFAAAAREIAESGVSTERIVIAVAQNANDQCETILFRMLRGTGTDGLSGIACKRYDESGFAVVRPLLEVQRSDIEAYCEEHHLSPRKDRTNEEAVYARNRIRLELIPYLEENFNPNLVETVNRLGRSAAADREYFDIQVAGACEEAVIAEESAPNGDMVSLNIEKLRDLHFALRVRVYNIILESIGLDEDMTAAHFEGIDSIVFSSSPSALWDLPHGYRAERSYGRLILRRAVPEDENGAANMPALPRLRIHIIPGCMADTGEMCPGLGKSDPQGDAVKITGVFSLDGLEAVYGSGAAGRITMRLRQDGDYMMLWIDGALHRKKLQDVLVDMKVSKNHRDDLWLAAVGSEILWILPSPYFSDERHRQKGRFSGNYKASAKSDNPRINLEYLM